MQQRAQRRGLFLILLLTTAALSLPASGAQAGRSGGGGSPAPSALPAFEVTIPPPEFGRTEEGWSTVRFPGYGEAAEGGDPSRPVRIFRIEMPAGSAARVEIIGTDYREYRSLDLAPAPRPEPQRLHPGRPAGDSGREPGAKRSHRRDRNSYRRAGWNPARPVEIGTTGFLRHRPYAQLRVYPLQYDPVRRRARIYSRIRFVIHPESRPDRAPLPRRRRREPEFDSIYRLGFPEGARVEAGADAAPAAPAGPETGTESTFLTTAAPAGGTPAYRILVSRTGIYRLTYEYLNDPARAADLIALDPNPADFKLESQGTEIPIRVENGGDPARFEPGEWIEFYGQHLEGDFLDPDLFEGGDFTDTNVYRLSVEAGGRLRIGDADGTPTAGHPVPGSFSDTAVGEESEIFLGQLPFDGAGHWYYQPMIREGRDGADNPIPGATDFTLNLSGTGTAGTARLEVRMLGVNYTDNLHRSGLEVNGTPVGAIEDWDGFVFHTQVADFDATLLVDGANTITVTAPLGRTTGTGDPVEIEAILLDRIELTFDRTFQAAGEELMFLHPNQDARFQIGGLGAGPVAYEVTALLPGTGFRNPVRITGGTVAGGVLTFEASQDGGLPPAADRWFAVASGAGLLLPDAVETDHPSDLRSTANGADWIVIGHRDLLDLTPGSNLDQVMALRQGQGLRTFVADVQDVYDEFSFGIRDPQAIRDFLRYAFFNWTPPAPLHVVLVGDATYDMKNHYGATETRIFVPTYPRDDSDSAQLGYYADETYFAAIAGADPLPDLLLGRIPAHDLAEAEGYWQKVLDYEIPTTGAAWESNVVFVADEGEPQFESVQENQIGKYFDGVLHTFERIYYQDIIDANGGLNVDATADIATGRIRNAIDTGAVTLNFVGHGGFQQWSRFPNIYQTLSNRVPPGQTPLADDVDPLANAPRYPFMINANCITGAFQITGEPDQPQDQDQSYSFAEDFLVTPSRGLIGALAPSHLTFSFTLPLVNNSLFDEMYGLSKERTLGKLQLALRLAFEQAGMIQDLQSYVFLGDPAVQLRLPAPEPPTGLVAVAGNQVVDLSWAASPEAATYNVYRAAGNPDGNYVRINSTPVTGTLYLDSTVLNSVTYYYAVASVDANGFEGRYSNFNLDCLAAGPDCVQALPLNPDPPATPTGLTAQDVGTGGRLFLAWSPNGESDLQFYTMHIGTAPGIYDQQKQIGPSQTSLDLPGLSDGVPYFFSLTATNTSGLASGFSTEVSATPRLLLGIAPPALVGNLQAVPDGADLLLTWDPVTVDINGDPIPIDHYVVYANSAGPDYLLAGNELDVVVGTATSYRHLGAFSDPSNYFYLVTAVDADGLASAASHEAPAPILDLRLRIVGGSLEIDWTPRSIDLLGNPTVISHYRLYSDAAPFSRSQVGPALLELDNIPAPPVVVPLPAGPRFYSVLPVDNRGTASPY